MSEDSSGQPIKPAEQHILDAIKAIRFGAVEVVIHDSRIVQVEKTEKIRFDAPRN